jgi:hypothetical protein
MRMSKRAVARTFVYLAQATVLALAAAALGRWLAS